MNIIITGASRGIGYEIAKAFASETGHNVLGISRSDELLKKLRSECEILPGGNALNILAYDLENIGRHTELKNKISEIMPKIDVLINNAGLLINKPFSEITQNDFDRLFSVNIKSIFNLTQLLLPSFSKNAHIVNISSMGGFQGSVKFPGLSVYSASKGAVAIFSECLAEELKPKNIFVNCLAIGSVQTEMLSQAFPGYQAPVSASDMGAFIKDFALSGHRFFNGKIIPVSVTTP
jgi:short-subunit dehydrogenase